MLAQSLSDQIHTRAIEISNRYKRAEAELVEVLIQVENHRVFIQRGHSSLFSYVVSELGLSESTAYNLITVSRKAREIPELKEEIKKGSITLSNAKRIAPVINKENKEEWLKKASMLSQRALEKEVVRVRPESAICERASYATPTRVRLELGLSEKEMLRLRRVQDLLSQSERRPVTLEETLATLTGEYLTRHDPVERAKRVTVKKNPPDSLKTLVSRRVEAPTQSGAATGRIPIPQAVLHQVNLRDERRCTFIKPDGKPCNQTRWIEIHHKKPVNQGGPNTLDNLTTLCSAHHDHVHQRD